MSPSRRTVLAAFCAGVLLSASAHAPARAGARAESPAPPVSWRDPGAALSEARRDKKIVLLEIDVTWSAWCTRMQRSTFADPGVREDIARSFVPTRIDAEDESRHVDYAGRTLTHRAFADRFRVSTYPTTVFLAADGTPITRVPGYVAPERFRTLLRYVAEGHYRKTTWDEFAGPPPPTDEDHP